MIRFAFVALGLGVLLCGVSHTCKADEPNFTWEFTDIEGKLHKPFDDDSTRGVVLIFISTDCPIANSYQPLLRRLCEQHSRNGIRFIMVHPHAATTIDQAQKHVSEFEIVAPIVIDSDQSISRRVGAMITPEAFVFVRNQPKPVYQGRIDNQYARFGKKRNVVTSHDLVDALNEVVAGRKPSKSITEAVGCLISYPK